MKSSTEKIVESFVRTVGETLDIKARSFEWTSYKNMKYESEGDK